MCKHKINVLYKNSVLHSLHKKLCNTYLTCTKKIITIAFLFSLYANINAQLYKKIEIKNSKTNEAIAFANIQFDNKQQGTVSDINGSFIIPTHPNLDTLNISCIGYKSKRLSIKELNNNTPILLEPTNIELSEVLILPKENPALSIVNKVISNRSKNNPDSNTSYSCLIYNKMTFALELPDNQISENKDLSKLWEFNKNNHLLLIESVSEKKHLPPNISNENIISGRVSGFKDPSLSSLPSQLQPFTFYNNYIKILNIDFLNPLTPQGLRSYQFILEETLIESSGDTIFYISYKPNKNNSINGLKGSLHIHKPTWGIKTVTATTIGRQTPFNITIKQNYTKHNTQWFPEQLETQIRIDKSITGTSFPFPLVGEGKSIVTAINLNPDLNKKDFSSIELNNHVSLNKDIEKYRQLSLTSRDSATYHLIDSLGQANNFDNFITFQKEILKGYLHMGPLNLNLAKLIDYNDYEGFKPGVGLQTSKTLFPNFSIEGFYSRSLKSEDNNYGGQITITPDNEKDQKWSVIIEKDLYATGAFSFLEGYSAISDERFARFAIKTVEQAKQIRSSYSIRFVPRVKTELFYSYKEIKPILAPLYNIDDNENEATSFNSNETGILLKWQPLATYSYSGLGITTLKNNFPTVWTNFTYGNGSATTPLEYYKTEVQIENSFKLTPIINTSIRITAGHLWGKHTGSHLYSSFGTYNKNLGIESRYSMATMRPNEFAANTFSLIFFRTKIPTRINKDGTFKPIITLSTSAGWSNVNNHYQEKVNTFNKGYYESGIYLGSLFKQMFIKYGIAIHYRYGPYHLSKEIDNWSFKIGLEIGL